MIKLILGEKGSGKTKIMLDDVTKETERGQGAIVFINCGRRHVYDLSHKVRLIDAQEYDVEDYSVFYGLLCGVISQNHDITHIYVDSISKVVRMPLDSAGLESLEKALQKCEALCEQNNVSLVVTLSIDPAVCPPGIKKYS